MRLATRAFIAAALILVLAIGTYQVKMRNGPLYIPEAKQPAGFPRPGRINEIVIKCFGIPRCISCNDNLEQCIKFCIHVGAHFDVWQVILNIHKDNVTIKGEDTLCSSCFDGIFDSVTKNVPIGWGKGLCILSPQQHTDAQ